MHLNTSGSLLFWFLSIAPFQGGGVLPTGSSFLPALKNFRKLAKKDNYYTGDVIRKHVDYRKDIGIIGGQLRYVAIHFRSTMAWQQPFSRGIEVRDLMDKFIEARQTASPSSMKSIKFHGNMNGIAMFLMLLS